MKQFAVKLFPKVDPAIGRIRFDVIKSLWLWSMLLTALFLGLPQLNLIGVTLATLIAGITFCLGHSVGLHRGIIHRSYEMPVWVRRLLAYLFVLTGLGGPLTWARIHSVRDYWQNQSSCPEFLGYKHSPWLDFWWNLHFRFQPADTRDMQRIPADIFKDPWLHFLERTWALHQLPLAAMLWLGFGPAVVASAICGRIAVGILCHWFISFATHAWGDQPHQIPDACEMGTNQWFLGVISFGEGFHNNHHAFPNSARLGLGPRDWDLGWYVILLMKRFGLVDKIHVASEVLDVPDRRLGAYKRPKIQPS